MLALLRAGPFRRYIIGSLISDSGTWMQWMAQGYVMSTLTDSAFMIGLATFATGIATIVFTPTGGSAADRSDKRKILIATQVAQIAFAVALGWLVQTHQVHMWHMILFGSLLGITIGFEMPAISGARSGIGEARGNRVCRRTGSFRFSRITTNWTLGRRHFGRLVGSSISLFRQRHLVCCAHHRAGFASETPHRHS
jgi:MFS family permease